MLPSSDMGGAGSSAGVCSVEVGWVTEGVGGVMGSSGESMGVVPEEVDGSGSSAGVN